MGSLLMRGKTWWICYYVKGKTDEGKERTVPSLVLHDCRRIAMRNLLRAGAPDKVAMAFTGHRTRSVFHPYNIVSERDLHEAGAKLAPSSRWPRHGHQR